MFITILQIGKTKHQFVSEAETEYLKRLFPFAKVDQNTLKEGKSQTNIALTKEEESKTLIEHLPKDSFIIALDETGKNFTSREFADQIRKIRDFQGGKITFIIGGPFGLADSIKSKANLLLSFSKLTFTHEMIRMLLLEQLYRAFTIISNKTYHY